MLSSGEWRGGRGRAKAKAAASKAAAVSLVHGANSKSIFVASRHSMMYILTHYGSRCEGDKTEKERERGHGAFPKCCCPQIGRQGKLLELVLSLVDLLKERTAWRAVLPKINHYKQSR